MSYRICMRRVFCLLILSFRLLLMVLGRVFQVPICLSNCLSKRNEQPVIPETEISVDAEAVMTALPRRWKLYLILGGTLVGVAFGGVIGFTIHHFGLFQKGSLPEGAQFNSVEDLRKAISERDSRDLKGESGVSLRSIIVPDPSDLIIYRLASNLNVQFQGVPVQTNSHGMRSPEISMDKAPGTYRLALMGDSFAFGWGVEEQHSFARVIERELNAQLGSVPKVELLNFGVPGYSTFQEVALFLDTAVKFHPDAVVIYFVENDFGLPFFIKNFGEGGELARDTSFSNIKNSQEGTEFEDDHQKLLHNLDPSRSLLKLAEYCEKNGLQVFLVINPSRNWEKHKKRLWALRQSKKLTLLPIRDEFKGIVNARQLSKEQLKLPNDPHPSALKQEILGEVIAAKLFPYLRLHSPNSESSNLEKTETSGERMNESAKDHGESTGSAE